MRSLSKVFLVVIVVLLAGCELQKEATKISPVTVRFVNETGKLIEDGKVLEKNLGTIAKDSETEPVSFDSFPIAGLEPDVNFSGYINDSIYNSNWNWCGTGKVYKYLGPGDYRVSISIDSTDYSKYFILKIK